MIHTGAVAVMDALGFKGIWDRWRPETVVNKFCEVIDGTRWFETETIAVGLETQISQTRKLRFLSDTIVIASANAPLPGTDPSDTQQRLYRFLALYDVCRAVAGLQSWFMTGALRPSLAYRGAVAWGRFTIEDQLLIGPATDEAAAAEKDAEAALVWFCPSALVVLNEMHNRPLAVGMSIGAMPVDRWPVPMKGGHKFETVAVAPYGQRETLLDGLRRAFFDPGELIRTDQPPKAFPVAVHVKYSASRDFVIACQERIGPE